MQPFSVGMTIMVLVRGTVTLLALTIISPFPVSGIPVWLLLFVQLKVAPGDPKN